MANIIANFLKNYKHLKKIILCNNNLSDSCAEIIVKEIKSYIEELHITENFLEIKSCSILMQTVK